MIYMDKAATSYHKPEEVAKAVYEAVKATGNSGRGANSASLNSTKMLYDTREKLCKLFNGKDSSRIAFTHNATEALNIVIRGLFKEGDHIITTEAEHNSVLRPLYRSRKEENTELTFIKCDKEGRLLISEIEKNIKENTKAIICTHASNLTGNIMDIEKIGKICRENNLIFIVDASQSAGSIPVDIEKQNIDVLCFTGHKSLYGAQGTGGLYVREGILIDPLKVGGSGIDTYNTEHPAEMPERLEAGTLNSHGIAGLKAGIDFINRTGLEKIHSREKELMWRFYNGIKDIKNIKIYGEFFDTDGREKDRIAIVSINLGDIDSAEICDILNIEYDIVTRAGGHCAPLMHKALGTDIQGAVRFSFSYFNTEEEIDVAINAIKEIAESF